MAKKKSCRDCLHCKVRIPLEKPNGEITEKERILMAGIAGQVKWGPVRCKMGYWLNADGTKEVPYKNWNTFKYAKEVGKGIRNCPDFESMDCGDCNECTFRETCVESKHRKAS